MPVIKWEFKVKIPLMYNSYHLIVIVGLLITIPKLLEVFVMITNKQPF